MTHVVAGLIGEPDFLRVVAGKRWINRLVELDAELALLPLPEDTADTPVVLGQSDTAGFRHLTPDVLQALLDASRGRQFIYFETEYFGGEGRQGAALFRDMTLEYGPTWDVIGPINTALRTMGVQIVPPAIDEFETIGLQRKRTTADWLSNRS